ncbi:hypothetical protein [Marinobacter zhanjiangensis]|uniref:Secreted protein n=1 Tax=Marinobacter zhanjiangensis TaxID=578215 RepID=A0ABQ3B7B9_9GAMM|nr:hypothetical protein [Marinobacter zhanjiangensis]GGY81858.1 hypothetical protein GCM10007071_31510 [Marinobacter zhanjiangensis]
MRYLTSVAGIVGAVLSFQPLAQEPDLTFRGVATALEGDQTLYQERHRISGTCEDGQWRPQQHRVDYLRDDADEPFATKALAYPSGLLVPEVDFRQPEFDERLRISVSDESLEIRWSAGGKGDERWTLDNTGDLVVDSGFDHFIRKHWATLTSGEAVEFRFLAPTRGEAYGFVAEPAAEPIEGADHSFRIRPTGMIMRLAVDPIRLGYRDDGFLTHYQGLGNIRKNQDENYQVAIRYSPNSAPPCALIPSS